MKCSTTVLTLTLATTATADWALYCGGSVRIPLYLEGLSGYSSTTN
jgi:hypothetical protein